MKKSLFISAAAIAMLISCSKSEQSGSDVRNDSTTIDTDTAQIASQDQRRRKGELDTKTIEFSVDCANKEVGELLRTPHLKDWSKNYALGGIIRIRDFFPSSLSDTSAGVMMWYTFEKIDNKDRIVMAFELSHIRNIRQMTPHTNSLQYPDSIFSFDPVHTFDIRKHKNAKAFVTKNLLNSSTVTRRMGRFDMLVNNYRDTDGARFNKANGAFFQNNPQPNSANTRGLLSRLVNQMGAEYIRYYFAYRRDYENRIRIILVATDRYGNNIAPIKKEGASVIEGLIVQKSIPPGPAPLVVCP